MSWQGATLKAMSRQWRVRFGVVGGLALLFVLVVLGVLERWEPLKPGERFPIYDFASALLGTAANIIMAGAALLAFTLWRKQIAGETHHDLARRLARLIETRNNATEAIAMWARVEGGSSDAAVLVRPFRELSSNIEELRKLELEAEAYWGRRYSKPIADFTFWCRVLCNAIEELGDRRPGGFYRIGMHVFDGGSPDSAGAQNVGSLATLLDEWLGSHVGRPSAVPFTEAEFDRRVQLARGTTQHVGWRGGETQTSGADDAAR